MFCSVEGTWEGGGLNVSGFRATRRRDVSSVAEAEQVAGLRGVRERRSERRAPRRTAVAEGVGHCEHCKEE